MPNIKISDLNRANRLSDEALIVVVQDNANKAVTVKELGNKINDNQNKLIAKLHDEIKQTSQGANIAKLKEITAKQQYQINNIKRTVGAQGIRLNNIEKSNGELRHEIGRIIKIVDINTKETQLTRKSLAYVNHKVDKVVKDVHNLGTYMSYVGQYTDQVAQHCEDNYAYLAQYSHFDRSQYWNSIDLGLKTN